MMIAVRTLVYVAVFLTAAQARAGGPAVRVAELVEKFKGFDSGSKGPAREKALAVLDDYFDLDAFAAGALGAAAGKLTPAQTTEFKQRLSDLVRRKGYPAGAGFFREGKAKAGGVKSADGKTTVPYEVYFPKEDLTVAVAFVANSAGRVTDVVVDGEPLSTDYKNQIARILAKNPPAELLRRLEQKQKEIGE